MPLKYGSWAAQRSQMPWGKSKVETLRAICKELGIPYAKLRREEILELLLDVEKTGLDALLQTGRDTRKEDESDEEELEQGASTETRMKRKRSELELSARRKKDKSHLTSSELEVFDGVELSALSNAKSTSARKQRTVGRARPRATRMIVTSQ